MGVSGNINQFQGDVEQYTFSVIELAVRCIDQVQPKNREWIGVVVSRDRYNFDKYSPAKTRLHVEYWKEQDGAPTVGGWDHKVAGFIPYPGRKFSPGAEVPASVVGGVQLEHRVDLFQAANGDWWIAFEGDLLGHYPASLFNMLNLAGCEVAWYAEVFDPTPAFPNWTWTDVGSGLFPTAGYGYAAYVRNPRYFDLLYAPHSPAGLNLEMTPEVPACYTKSPLMTDLPWFAPVIYMDGPGGDAPGCD